MFPFLHYSPPFLYLIVVLINLRFLHNWPPYWWFNQPIPSHSSSTIFYYSFSITKQSRERERESIFLRFRHWVTFLFNYFFIILFLSLNKAERAFFFVLGIELISIAWGKRCFFAYSAFPSVFDVIEVVELYFSLGPSINFDQRSTIHRLKQCHVASFDVIEGSNFITCVWQKLMLQSGSTLYVQDYSSDLL